MRDLGSCLDGGTHVETHVTPVFLFDQLRKHQVMCVQKHILGAHYEMDAVGLQCFSSVCVFLSMLVICSGATGNVKEGGLSCGLSRPNHGRISKARAPIKSDRAQYRLLGCREELQHI